MTALVRKKADSFFSEPMALSQTPGYRIDQLNSYWPHNLSDPRPMSLGPSTLSSDWAIYLQAQSKERVAGERAQCED